jgi:hypothetical protein
MRHSFGRIALVVLLLLAGGSRLSALGSSPRLIAERRTPNADSTVLAQGWSIGKFVAGGGRARIVQICVVVLCIALFIMMRKLR